MWSLHLHNQMFSCKNRQVMAVASNAVRYAPQPCNYWSWLVSLADSTGLRAPCKLHQSVTRHIWDWRMPVWPQRIQYGDGFLAGLAAGIQGLRKLTWRLSLGAQLTKITSQWLLQKIKQQIRRLCDIKLPWQCNLSSYWLVLEVDHVHWETAESSAVSNS